MPSLASHAITPSLRPEAVRRRPVEADKGDGTFEAMLDSALPDPAQPSPGASADRPQPPAAPRDTSTTDQDPDPAAATTPARDLRADAATPAKDQPEDGDQAKDEVEAPKDLDLASPVADAPAPSAAPPVDASTMPPVAVPTISPVTLVALADATDVAPSDDDAIRVVSGGGNAPAAKPAAMLSPANAALGETQPPSAGTAVPTDQRATAQQATEPPAITPEADTPASPAAPAGTPSPAVATTVPSAAPATTTPAAAGVVQAAATTQPDQEPVDTQAAAQVTNAEVPKPDVAAPRTAGPERPAKPNARGPAPGATPGVATDQTAAQPAATEVSTKAAGREAAHAPDAANAAPGAAKEHDGAQKPAHAHEARDAESFNPITPADARPTDAAGAGRRDASLDGSQPAIATARAATQATATTAAAAAVPNAPYAATSAAPVPIAGLAVEIVTQARDGRNRFEIRLDPPELGRIDVHLHVDRDGTVSSRLIVERSETLDLLKRDAPSLERALQDAGLKTGSQGMEFSLRQQTPGRDHEGGNGARATRVIVPDDVQALSAGTTYARRLGTGGGIDIRV